MICVYSSSLSSSSSDDILYMVLSSLSYPLQSQCPCWLGSGDLQTKLPPNGCYHMYHGPTSTSCQLAVPVLHFANIVAAFQVLLKDCLTREKATWTWWLNIFQCRVRWFEGIQLLEHMESWFIYLFHILDSIHNNMQFLYSALYSNELKALHILLPPAHLYTPTPSQLLNGAYYDHCVLVFDGIRSI